MTITRPRCIHAEMLSTSFAKRRRKGGVCKYVHASTSSSFEHVRGSWLKWTLPPCVPLLRSPVLHVTCSRELKKKILVGHPRHSTTLCTPPVKYTGGNCFGTSEPDQRTQSYKEFLKVLKAAHAKPAVLEYVRREYRCADCDAHTKPQPSRKAAIPRTYEFNRIIALDVFYIPLRGQSLPVLNIICHGTNFQVAALMRQDGTPTAAMVWSTFQRSWRRYFGTPDVMITDGGPEFRGDFAQSGEYAWHSTSGC